jgi:hypothetical protein
MAILQPTHEVYISPKPGHLARCSGLLFQAVIPQGDYAGQASFLPFLHTLLAGVFFLLFVVFSLPERVICILLYIPP